MYVMTEEPIPNMTATDVKAYFSDKQTEKDLADAYAITHNKFWWVEDNEYDYEEGSPEHKTACAITDEWGTLMDEYKNKIFETLISEGITIPTTGQIKVLEPFMNRFGYIDCNGWWVKQEK
ncbi:MAG: hypothetical protein IJ470_05985 [Clostridia bacterium]|nr:hypothetical protein [Clostridia bacterium]